MSYMTDFTLTAGPFPPEFSAGDRDRLAQELENMGVFDCSHMEDDFCEASVYATWYESDDDMLLLSTRFPGLVFTLTGCGENHDDIWISYYRDGCSQHEIARIEYGDFDPAKLKPGKVQDTGQHYSYQL